MVGLDVTLYEVTRTVCSGCGKEDEQREEVFSANYTHNVTNMAALAGIYIAIWYPEEIGLTKARHLIPFLELGVQKLRGDPAQFKNLNPPNGWGSYETFLPWVESYLLACKIFPDALVETCR